MSTIPTQIERWQRAEITGEQLLRDLVGHEDWRFFVVAGEVAKWQQEGGSPDYWLLPDEGGAKHLAIFSDNETITTYVQQSGITEWRCEVVVAAGRDLFSSLPDDLASLTVNPLTPLTVSYAAAQLQMLRHIADAAYMEATLKSLSDGSIQSHEALNRVLADFQSYENFHLVSVLSEAGHWTYPRYTSQGDDDLRWVVAFTASDHATLYLKECAAELPGRYRIERLNGLHLAKIALELHSPGILFNWGGYVAPLMLNAQFLHFVCDAP